MVVLLALAGCPGELGVMPISVGKGWCKKHQGERAGGKASNYGQVQTAQTKGTNPNCMMMPVIIITDVLVAAVNKNNGSNKIAMMMLAIVLMLMIIMRLFINCEPLSAFSSASAFQTRPKLQPYHINIR